MAQLVPRGVEGGRWVRQGQGDRGTEMVRLRKTPERGRPPLRLGARLGFAVGDINIYHVSHFRERDHRQGWKNNKR